MTTKKLSHSIANFAALTDIPRSRLYEDIKAGRLRIFKVGRRTFIRGADGDRYLEQFRRAGDAGRHGELDRGPPRSRAADAA
jgi:hypothetical protein